MDQLRRAEVRHEHPRQVWRHHDGPALGDPPGPALRCDPCCTVNVARMLRDERDEPDIFLAEHDLLGLNSEPGES